MKKKLAVITAVACVAIILGCSDLYNELAAKKSRSESASPIDNTEEEEKFPEQSESVSPTSDLTIVNGVNSADESVISVEKNDDDTITITSKGAGTTTFTFTGKGDEDEFEDEDMALIYPVTVDEDGTIELGEPSFDYASDELFLLDFALTGEGAEQKTAQ